MRLPWRSGDGRRWYTVKVRLTPPQAEAFEDMLAVWNQLSSQGGSRWTSFYADGDGNFHPRALFAGRRARRSSLSGEFGGFWGHRGGPGDEYRMDFDTIAWARHND